MRDLNSTVAPRRVQQPSFWTGLTLILIGAVFLLDTLDLMTIDLRTWWPAALVIIGALQFTLADRTTPLGERGGLWMMIVGDWLLLNKLTVLSPVHTWPLLMVAAGVLMVMSYRPKHNNTTLVGQH